MYGFLLTQEWAAKGWDGNGTLFPLIKLSNKFVFPVEAAKVQEIRATINPTDNGDG